MKCVSRFKKKQQKTKQMSMQGLVSTKYQSDLWHTALTISGFKIFFLNSHCYIPLHSIVIKAKKKNQSQFSID
jgi:hypothetical protein